MQNIKILAIHHTIDKPSATTIVLDNILSALRKKASVNVTWLIYTPEKLNSTVQIESNKKIIDIHDFKNALEILQKEKPDIIFADAYTNLIHYALSLAGKFYKIPIISDFSIGITPRTNLRQLIKSNLSMFFENTVPADVGKKKL